MARVSDYTVTVKREPAYGEIVAIIVAEKANPSATIVFDQASEDIDELLRHCQGFGKWFDPHQPDAMPPDEVLIEAALDWCGMNEERPWASPDDYRNDGDEPDAIHPFTGLGA